MESPVLLKMREHLFLMSRKAITVPSVMRPKRALDNVFFDTLSKCGGHLSALEDEEKPNPCDLSEENPIDKQWHSMCGGPKNAAK